ncbi:S-adenosylhomocysteine deaminase [Rathayibacter caricis DSM 15933]|uniref:S-adenosylhomocysteine deaminase n=1 Tax=Rathayibacter caricis DSM 15933 TaxID=1328867 RepID=A0A2T4UPI4_9MICO|nr:amidohydrolase family protein [Rathayibacter caricis]PTL71445.1 S-adenosylhomocysteine deaminase [Rathayibacter caricis DSM 15933]
MTRTLIVADHVLPDVEADELGPAVVAVEDGIVLSVDPLRGARPRGADVVDLGRSVVLPGLVNAHAHAPMMLFRGVSEGHSLLTLEGWLGAIRSLEEHLSPELLSASASVACAEMIGSGTTSFADQYLFAESYLAAIEDSGLRARVAYGIVELGDDAVRARELAAAESFVAASQEHPLVRGWVGPHAFFVDNQVVAMEAEVALAHRFGVGLHTHFATSGEEEDACRERYGRGALETMAGLGLFDVPLLLAHSNEIVVEDLALLAGSRASLVAAASVAMISGAAAPPFRQALDAGVNVAIGTDNLCGNNNADLFEELRTLGKLAAFAERRPNAITSRELLGLATWRGHRALGGAAEDGSLVPGAVADLIALPVEALHRGPVAAQSLHSALVYGASGFDTSDVMTAGRWLKRDGAVTTVDLAAAVEQRQRDHDILMERVRAG